MSKKKKLRRQRDQARRELFLASAVLRSCDDFARMVRDYTSIMDRDSWAYLHRRWAEAQEGSDTDFVHRNAVRIAEMTEQYTHADRDTEPAVREP